MKRRTPGQRLMITRESWIAPSGEELLAEQTEYYFIAKGRLRIIDRCEEINDLAKEFAIKY